jgi:DNA-binding transcriptional LysR family regulator
MHTLHSSEAYDTLESGRVDVGFVSITRYSELVASVPVFEDPMVLVCAADAPYRDGMTPDELDARWAVNLTASHEFLLWYHYWFGASAQAALTDNFVLAERILQTTPYWCMAPLSAARGSAATRGLRIVRIQNPPPDRTVYMLTRGAAGPLAQELARYVREAADDVS